MLKKCHRGFFGILCLAAALLVSSCSGTKHARLQRHLTASSCNQQNEFRYRKQEVPRPLHELNPDTILTNRFSFSSLNAAHAIGILDLLYAYVSGTQQHEASRTTEHRIAMMELSQEIHRKINLASLEISSVASELDCEEEMLTQIADYMNHKERETETRLTVTAIVTGATGALVTGLLLRDGGNDDNIEYVGIAAGITEASLGLMILLNKKRMEIFHPRNALQEIWEGRDTSSIFPAPVWYYLNYYNPHQQGATSPRYQIIERWMGFRQIEDAGSAKKRKLLDLYFGAGGKYTTEQLYNRANMYDQLESYIKLIKQDLMVLSVELEQLK